MGICYAEQEEWNTYQNNYRTRRKNKKKNNFSSIIYEQKTIHQSFIEKPEASLRQDIYDTLNGIKSDFGSIMFGSVVEMSDEELSLLQAKLELINPDGQIFNREQPITLCNLKTKNFLHTHKIKDLSSKRYNQVSACPYNSNHIIEYDLWKIIPVEAQSQSYYIYHPLTQCFQSIFNGKVVTGSQKYIWNIKDFGKRRNGGFIQVYVMQNGVKKQLCMTDQAGILPNHRMLKLCTQKHIGHLWELKFGECIMQCHY